MTEYERHAFDRDRDGADFVDYVYDAVLHRWVYRPLPPPPPTARELLEEDARDDAWDERARERAEADAEDLDD